MRLGNLGDRLVVITDEGAIDVASACDGAVAADPMAAYSQWDEVITRASTLRGEAIPYDDAELLAPVPHPRQVFAIALNYASHAAEAGAPLPEHPATFTKFPTCVAPPHTTVVLPSDKVDWEVELVVVIGRRAHQVGEADAWSYVAGLTVGQDLSERAVQMRPPVPQFSLGKSYPGFGPMGPWLVTPDELENPDDLEISCTLNGEQVQRSRSSDLIFPVAGLISRLSAIVPLLPGDVIFTGTPAGVGVARKPPRYLEPGDELVSTIEGIGTICTRLEANGPPAL